MTDDKKEESDPEESEESEPVEENVVLPGDVSELPESRETPASIPVPRRNREEQESANYDIIRAALESHLMDYAKRKNEQKRNLEHLSSTIEEFMDSFILIGYNYDGEPLTLVSASNQQQADSLSTLLQKFIVNSGNSPGAPPFI